jgi:ribosomal protein L23
LKPFKKMKISPTALILIAVAVVVLIVIVIGAVRFKISASAAIGKSMSSASPDSRHSVNGAAQPNAGAPASSQKVATPNRGVPQKEVPPQPKVEVQAGPEFPRHKAMAGKAESLADLQQRIRSNANFKNTDGETPRAQEKKEVRAPAVAQPIPQQQIQQKTSVKTVHVSSVAELFSVKEDVEAEFGVTPEEMGAMVAQYKKSREYVERALPVSRYFSIDTYNESRQTLRESAKVMGVNHATKRGQITGAIYKKYGKNFTKSRHQATGDVMSSVVGNAEHREHLAKDRGSRAQGHLEVVR